MMNTLANVRATDCIQRLGVGEAGGTVRAESLTTTASVSSKGETSAGKTFAEEGKGEDIFLFFVFVIIIFFLLVCRDKLKGRLEG